MSRPETPSFAARSEHELFALDDGALLEHIAAAKRTGQPEQARLAMWMLLYRHEPRIRRRVAVRLPRHLAHHADTVAEWVIQRVTRSALRLALEGQSPGEWASWWGTAVDRQVISFFRTVLGQSLEAEVPADERLGEDFDVDRLVERVCLQEIVETVLARMDNDMHVAVVRAAFWDDRPSAEVAAQHATSAANVDQIKSRFRRDVRAECLRRGLMEG